MIEEAEFTRRVESWIESLVRQGERDFANLVCRLPGVDPICVAQVLKRLGESSSGGPYRQLHDQACRPAAREGLFSAVPFVPHPLDFDWRFTAASAVELVGQIFALTKPTHVALLGTPTLIPAIESRLAPKALRLFDKNSLWRDWISRGDPSLRVTACDFSLDDIAADALAAADVVIMDPPWYPTIQRAYFWAAVQLVRPGGFVVTTVPPKGTRPRVLAERTEMEAYADLAGLAPVTSSEGSVRYVSPPFEVNALRAAGVFRALPEWRSGDLSIYQSRRAPVIDRPRRATPEITWSEVIIGGVRIKARLTGAAANGIAASPELVPLVRGDVLPSVSARHPVREQIDVWTSGNRVFKCKNTKALLELCEPLRHNAAPSALCRHENVQSSTASSASAAIRAVSQVLAIVATESNEYLARQ